jgi:hypothetical protein
MEVARKIAAKHAGVRVFRFVPNVGTYVGLNTLATLSSGDLLAILDGDDVSSHGRLSYQLGCFMRRADLEICASSKFNRIDDSGRLLGVSKECPVPPTMATIASHLKSCNLPVHSSWMIKRAFFFHTGGYKPWRCGADYDFWLRSVAMGARTEICRSEPLVFRRERPGQLTDAGGATGSRSAARLAAWDSIMSDLESYLKGRSPTKEQMAIARVAETVEHAQEK